MDRFAWRNDSSSCVWSSSTTSVGAATAWTTRTTIATTTARAVVTMARQLLPAGAPTNLRQQVGDRGDVAHLDREPARDLDPLRQIVNRLSRAPSF
ncbi:hypothetical protein CHU98_g12585 [Xylaria longipes]|nr:hypothetical protein CHU98_g12585 [Xylaria longipes]